jgi:hypothetical protein
LSRRHGLLLCGAVCEYARHVYDFGNPTPVRLKFCFDLAYDVRHAGILTCPAFCDVKLWLDCTNIQCRI